MSGTVLAIFKCHDHTLDTLLGAMAGEGIRLTKMGIDQIPHSGKPDQLLDHYEIRARAIVDKVKQLV
ncbi:MAG TPA: hypothetical protein VLA60_10705 [Nitrospirales bacterium]|nr:hypothetical protein [Nitrospirales bacterium]